MHLIFIGSTGDHAGLTLITWAIARRLLEKKDLDPETAKYLKKKLESAQWLIQALDGRCRTLKNISEAVLDFQQDFVKHGPSQLRPLKMQG